MHSHCLVARLRGRRGEAKSEERINLERDYGGGHDEIDKIRVQMRVTMREEYGYE
jgi:hypothetical protein